MILNPDGSDYKIEYGKPPKGLDMAIDECGKVALKFLANGKTKEKLGALACVEKLKSFLSIPPTRRPDDLVYFQELIGQSGDIQATHGYYNRNPENAAGFTKNKISAGKLTRAQAEAWEAKLKDYFFVIEDA